MIKSCYNCQVQLKEQDAFCFNCGQKVDDNNLRLKVVFREFYENYLSLDTRIGRSILPFLFQPGKLALEFIKGKRSTYVNPFRFYLIISIFFFFVLGSLVDKSVNKSKADNSEKSKAEQLEKDGNSSLSDKLENLAHTLDSIEKVDSSFVVNNIDSLLKANELDQDITYNVDSIKRSKNFVNFNSDGLGFNFDAKSLKQLKDYRYDKSYTDQQLLDSLQTDSIDRFGYIIGLQAIKLYRSDAKVISRFVLGNLSLAMLILIPGLAFIFFLFYYKQRLTFVAHLIHSLQFHTFSLFVYALSMIAIYYFENEIWMWFAFLISALYLFFSLKKLYPKTIFSTFWRYTGIGIIYYFFWIFTVTLGTILSFLLF